jgi:hypothetical protein
MEKYFLFKIVIGGFTTPFKVLWIYVVEETTTSLFRTDDVYLHYECIILVFRKPSL